MRIIGCDLQARHQTVAMLDTGSGELVEKTLQHDGEELRKFYSGLSRPVLVGIGPNDAAIIRCMERNWCCAEFQMHATATNQPGSLIVTLVWRAKGPRFYMLSVI